MKKIFALAFLFLFFTDPFLLTASPRPPALRTGTWRARLVRKDGQEIVFNFLSAKKNGQPVLYLINAKERLLVDSIRTSADSVWIHLPFFGARLRARITTHGDLQGEYIKSYGDRQMVLPFSAEYGNASRYGSPVKPSTDFSGRWAVRFDGQDELDTLAVGEFEQKPDGTVTGTFLTPTGDYRYLQGNVSGDTLRLSAFDGGHVYYFIALASGQATIDQAMMYSGAESKLAWRARKDPQASLPDEDRITQLKPGEKTIQFRFPSTQGDTISLQDERFRNKVVIVQILGSWCPNCMDETAFLSQYYNTHRNTGVEIIGLAYERTGDFEQSKKALQAFQNRFHVQYPFLITGVTVGDEHKTEKTLPQLQAIEGFPTTLFIGKDGQVARIHTGFNGPGTGKHYDAETKAFEQEIRELLSTE